jgi:surfactin synthase thioesterase subunit
MICFPGAGSFGAEFAAVTGARVMRYPGRHGRDFGVPAGSFEEVVSACVDQLSRRAPQRPVLLGHSFGAYVAYAVAGRLPEVAALVVVGASARPEVPRLAGAAEVAAYLDRVDPSALAGVPSPEWREIVVAAAAADLRLLRSFDPAGHPVLGCPVLAARGQDDPLTSDAGLDGWAPRTTGPFTRQVFPGGHSDLLRSAAFLDALPR